MRESEYLKLPVLVQQFWGFVSGAMHFYLNQKSVRCELAVPDYSEWRQGWPAAANQLSHIRGTFHRKWHEILCNSWSVSKTRPALSIYWRFGKDVEELLLAAVHAFEVKDSLFVYLARFQREYHRLDRKETRPPPLSLIVHCQQWCWWGCCSRIIEWQSDLTSHMVAWSRFTLAKYR